MEEEIGRKSSVCSAEPEVLLIEIAGHVLTGVAKTSSGNKEKAPPDPLTPASYQGRQETTCGVTRKIEFDWMLMI